MRYGRSIGQQGTKTGRMIVTVEKPGEPIRYIMWTGRDKQSIMRAAKAHYKDCKLRFGVVLYTNSYGAH